MIGAQYKLIHFLSLVQVLELFLLLQEGSSLFFIEVLLVVGVPAEGNLIVRILRVFLMEDVFLAISPVGIILSVDRLLIARLWRFDMLHVLRALGSLLFALVGLGSSSVQGLVHLVRV